MTPRTPKTSSSLPPVAEAETRRPDPATGREDPATASRLPSRPGRVRTRTPAGAVRRAEAAAPAGPKALRGEEWRQAVKAAQAKTRRRKTAPAARSAVPLPGLPAASSVRLIATASCNGCEWTAGPGSMADVDDAAEKHVSVGHPTAVIAEPEAGAA